MCTLPTLLLDSTFDFIHNGHTALPLCARTAMHCYAIHCYALLCYTLLCTVMLYTAMHCYAIHCYTVICTAMHAYPRYTPQQ